MPVDRHGKETLDVATMLVEDVVPRVAREMLADDRKEIAAEIDAIRQGAKQFGVSAAAIYPPSSGTGAARGGERVIQPSKNHPGGEAPAENGSDSWICHGPHYNVMDEEGNLWDFDIP